MTIASFTYSFALIASLAWFAMAFRYFGFQQTAAAKVLVPESARGSPLFLTTAASIRFLGGMNGAFALMCAILLAIQFGQYDLFTSPVERGVLLCILGAAHFSQFVFNLPVLSNGERQGDAYWPVVSGPMLIIFVVDALETMINLGAGLLLFSL